MDFKKNYTNERGGRFNEIDIEEWMLYSEWLELKMEALLLMVKKDKDCLRKIYDLNTRIVGELPRKLIEMRESELKEELKKLNKIRKPGGASEKL